MLPASNGTQSGQTPDKKSHDHAQPGYQDVLCIACHVLCHSAYENAFELPNITDHPVKVPLEKWLGHKKDPRCRHEHHYNREPEGRAATKHDKGANTGDYKERCQWMAKNNECKDDQQAGEQSATLPYVDRSRRGHILCRIQP